MHCALALLIGIALRTEDHEKKLNPEFYELVAQEYPVELHAVHTEDGYILNLDRIPFGRHGDSGGPRPAVLVMHGLLGSSGNFVYLDPRYSIAYNLADAGFDVWLGNARGNVYSRRHRHLDPVSTRDKPKFFDFSWHEIGVFDLPAMVDYIIYVTGQKKIHYVGHSQGGTIFFVLNTMKPWYNEKFKTAHLLSPAGYQKEYPLVTVHLLADLVDLIYETKKVLGLVDVVVGSAEILIDILNNQKISGLLSALFDLIFAGKYHGTAGILPAAASLKQFAHYLQNIRDREFRQWDHGFFKNYEIYGKFSPPNYDLRLVNVKTTLYYSMGDDFVSVSDVQAMAKDMPNGRASMVQGNTFTHFGYLVSEDVKHLVTDNIIHEIKERS